MHELSLAEALYKTVETWQKENGGKILSVTVEIGRLGGVDPDSLKYAFSLVAPYPVKTVLLPSFMIISTEKPSRPSKLENVKVGFPFS